MKGLGDRDDGHIRIVLKVCILLTVQFALIWHLTPASVSRRGHGNQSVSQVSKAAPWNLLCPMRVWWLLQGTLQCLLGLR